ncbi:hypothetical protein ACWEQC_21345 [Streptomyces shenzhenensis]
MSDGVHDQIPAETMERLVRDPQALPDALVAAAQEDEDGYRDDATAFFLSIPNDQGGTER